MCSEQDETQGRAVSDVQGGLSQAERDTIENLGTIFMPHARKKALERWPSRQGTARFIHYTTAEAALKIIEGRQLWMRNALCMSDYREVRHGYELLLSSKDKLHELRTVLDECVPKAGTEGIETFDKLFPAISVSSYVTSISEHDATEDLVGRLSMWRAFGNSSSARVGLVFAIPWQSDAALALGLTFSPVGYFGKDEVRQQIEQIIHNIREHSAFLREVKPQELVRGMVYAMLLAAVTCLKHWGFHEEREWRALYNPQLPGASWHMQTSTVSVQGVPQLVYNIPLDAKACPPAADLDFRRIFDRLIIGPSQFAEPMRHAFVRALMDSGVAEAWTKVVISDIPIRT